MSGGSVLLLGASGFFGTALRRVLGSSAVCASRNATPGDLRFDARATRIAELVAGLSARPTAAVILFGITGIDNCARDPLATAAVNVVATIRIINELRELGITPVFVSSDGVFDGRRKWYRDSDTPHPILTYGRQKVEVEKHLARLPERGLVVRLPRLLAENADPRCMLTAWVGALAQGREILCANDQFFTPAAVDDVARSLVAVIGERRQGVVHIAGPERLSRHDLLAAVTGEYVRHATIRARVTECSIRDERLRFVEERPYDTSLACEDRLRPASEVARAAVRACLRIWLNSGR